MNLAGPAELIHAPLAHWARTRGSSVAVDDGHTRLSFAQLHESIEAQARALEEARAPATVFLDERQTTAEQLQTFLAVIASGRCAAVGDPDWTPAMQQAARGFFEQAPASMPAPQAHSPFYVGFTSGSTGLPKGFARDHRSWAESLQACLQAFGPDAATRVMAPGRISHSLFLFGMVLGLWTGAGVVVQERFSPAQSLATLAEGHTPCLVAVPSQLALLLEQARRRGHAPIEGVRLILISGARWMRQRTRELQTLFPNARIVEFYGASETSFIAWMEADEDAPAQAVGRPFHNVDIEVREADAQGAGLIYVRSPMLFSHYVGTPDHTAALRDGPWLSVRDMGWLTPSGLLCLAGRQQRMVVTQGKNLFPEEVESLLCTHPQVQAASVHGLPDPVRGQQVVAIVQPRGASALAAAALAAFCREHLEPFKTPRQFFTVLGEWPQTPGGKTDHPQLARALTQLGEENAWLHPLR